MILTFWVGKSQPKPSICHDCILRRGHTHPSNILLSHRDDLFRLVVCTLHQFGCSSGAPKMFPSRSQLKVWRLEGCSVLPRCFLLKGWELMDEKVFCSFLKINCDTFLWSIYKYTLYIQYVLVLIYCHSDLRPVRNVLLVSTAWWPSRKTLDFLLSFLRFHWKVGSIEVCFWKSSQFLSLPEQPCASYDSLGLELQLLMSI